MKSVATHLLHHFYRILKAVSCKLVVTLPVNSKPSGVEVYHIGGNLIFSQVGGNVESFLL